MQLRGNNFVPPCQDALLYDLKLDKRNAYPPHSRRFKQLLTEEEAHKKMNDDLERIYSNCT